MGVALVHDWLTGMRGGERVLERLCGLFPDAPVFTLVWNRGSVSRSIESHPIHVSFLQRMPAAERRYRWYLPLFPRAVESFDLTGFDAVISSSHAVAKGARTPPGTFHLCYVHTPMRYVWDLEQQYFPPGRFPWPASAYVRSACERLRRWDVATSRRAHVMVANSAHVAERIARHYGRQAEVIHPPVDLARFAPGDGPREHYLLAGAMAPYKRGDLAVEACRALERKLVVVGTGQMEGALRRLAGPRVEFRGWVAEEEMAALYRGARALLFPGEEDFGMIPVEAMASGCPVVAYGRGGVLETVARGVPAETLARVANGGAAVVPGGVLFGTASAPALADAIQLLERTSFDPAALAERARPFDAPRFDAELMDAFHRGYAARRERGAQT
jgi:glycosyltransferase involved in cell wall biosynthesis